MKVSARTVCVARTSRCLRRQDGSPPGCRTFATGMPHRLDAVPPPPLGFSAFAAGMPHRLDVAPPQPLGFHDAAAAAWMPPPPPGCHAAFAVGMPCRNRRWAPTLGVLGSRQGLVVRERERNGGRISRGGCVSWGVVPGKKASGPDWMQDRRFHRPSESSARGPVHDE